MKTKWLFILVFAVLCSLVFAEDIKLGSKPVPASIGATVPHARIGPSFGANKASKVDLSSLFPKPGNQGMQNSCVAWASAYAVKSYQEHIERSSQDFAANSAIFSPSFIYNQINGGQDEGSTLFDAATVLKNLGAAPVSIMPYTMDFRKKPDTTVISAAAAYRIESFERVRPDDVEVMKDFLRKGIPVVIGMELRSSFINYSGGVYKSLEGAIEGGHAMTLVGFDDNKQAFRILNSWGPYWGEAGYILVDYTAFAQSNRDAVVLYDFQAAMPEVISVPLGISAGQGTSTEQIEVLWNQVAGAESYLVYRSLKATSDFVQVAEVKGTVYYDNNAEEGTFYYYAVRAKNPRITSDYSQAAQGFLQVQPGIGIVQELQGNYLDKELRLWWTAVNGAKGYNIYRYLAEKDGFALLGTSVDTAWADKEAAKKPGTYYYLVTAFNDKREGPNSQSISLVVPSAPVVYPLVSPRNVVVSKGSQKDRVDLSWEAVPGAQQYVILRYVDENEVWQIIDGTKSLTYSDKKPLAKSAWYAVVSRMGDNLSPIDDFFEGYTSRVKAAQKEKTYDDADYYGSARSSRTKLPEANKFKNDTVLAKPGATIKTFVPQDFFFVDEAKFFAIDPDFFTVPDNFFADTKNFF